MYLHTFQLLEVPLPDFLMADGKSGLMIHFKVIAMSKPVLRLDAIVQDPPGFTTEFQEIIDCYAGVKMGEMVRHINKMTHGTPWFHHPFKFQQDIFEYFLGNVLKGIIGTDESH